MFDNTESICRAAACLTFTDGRTRYVAQGGTFISLERPDTPHVEIWRSSEIPNLVFGTAVRPCPAMNPETVYGIVYQEGDRRLVRDWSPKEYLVFERQVDQGLAMIEDETRAVWGRQIVQICAGFVVRAVRAFQVGADRFTLVEDGDGDEFLVKGTVGQLCLT